MSLRAEAASVRLRALVLGAAAGGGFPQWNCNCANCAAFRRGDAGFEARTQSSLAVSVDGRSWALLNASPDLGSQILKSAVLHPDDPERAGLRHSPIGAVLVTNGDIDHVAGLLTLREKQAFELLSTAGIATVLDANPIFSALDPALVRRRVVTLDTPFELLPNLTATLFAVPGKVPLYLEGDVVETDLEGEQTVGVELRGPGGEGMFYIPGCARMTPKLAARLEGADCVLFDGTVWHDDEMIRMGVGAKTGKRMGHMSMAGEDGSIAAFAPLGVRRRVFVHINNTNPALNRFSPERAEATQAGWEIAFDGMEIEL
ncbi:pyrroloquinoline quinone biosynthesis protein PqqB [Methylobrevis albus]|uniref:Coenzyme PQQ synthesis protein B n=1 Tax=Methylobrevis albus TaxID=2793297 RepID=A0A931HZV3_9HYPH|nr:pyrroloquinoline quinone biosynthesis protein PqqB [Methylobrevis albus]MBH0236759.1 pyrroloquinoline quinone biosynthesis protein PqqB [Methylobrevis albus]